MGGVRTNPSLGTARPSVAPGSRARAWWVRRGPLARDLIVILLVKAIALWLLWFAFFRTPAAPHMTMDPQAVENRMIGRTPPAVPPESSRVRH